MVEAGGIEQSKRIENTQVADSSFPAIPPKQAIPPILARFGTVAAAKI
jgi:hypothetical protein